VAVVADGATFRIYINGEFVNQSNCSFGGENTNPLHIGNSDQCPDTFPGLIDEVRIWNTAKSDFEIELSHDCTFDNPPADLVGYWKFDEKESSQAILDSSLSGFDGSLGADLDPGDDDPVRIASTAPLICRYFDDGFENLE
jgi:hypothetical protein